MGKRKITARELLADVKQGLGDPALMEKYKLSAQGLQSVFQKLVKAGLMTQAELDSRNPSSERTVDIGLYICTACGNIQSKEFTTCPRCGFEPPRTKTLIEEAPRPQFAAAAKRPDKQGEADKSPKGGETGPEAVVKTDPLSDYQQVLKYARTLAIAATVCYAVFIVALLLVAGFAARQPFPYLANAVIAVVAMGALGTILFVISWAMTGVFRHLAKMVSTSSESS
jgi:uncharacterized membrane protein (DUF485 family)